MRITKKQLKAMINEAVKKGLCEAADPPHSYDVNLKANRETYKQIKSMLVDKFGIEAFASHLLANIGSILVSQAEDEPTMLDRDVELLMFNETDPGRVLKTAMLVMPPSVFKEAMKRFAKELMRRP